MVNSSETDPRPQRARVLLVDDDQAFLTALTDCLRYRFPNMVIETACRVDAALLLVAAITYDAIISDFRMPGMNGLSLLQEVVRLRPETSLIMVTAHGDNHLEEQAVHWGPTPSSINLSIGNRSHPSFSVRFNALPCSNVSGKRSYSHRPTI